jgi:uncharacterized protein
MTLGVGRPRADQGTGQWPVTRPFGWRREPEAKGGCATDRRFGNRGAAAWAGAERACRVRGGPWRQWRRVSPRSGQARPDLSRDKSGKGTRAKGKCDVGETRLHHPVEGEKLTTRKKIEINVDYLQEEAMDKHQYMLAAMAAAGQDASLSPVQVQKLFFLIDREASHLVSGPHFAFSPYDYGPFDRGVYDELDTLRVMGFVAVRNEGRIRQYALNPIGYLEGRKALDGLPRNTREYLSKLALWVRSLSFQQLVSAVYKRHPDMKINSIFQE